MSIDFLKEKCCFDNESVLQNSLQKLSYQSLITLKTSPKINVVSIENKKVTFIFCLLIYTILNRYLISLDFFDIVNKSVCRLYTQGLKSCYILVKGWENRSSRAQWAQQVRGSINVFRVSKVILTTFRLIVSLQVIPKWLLTTWCTICYLVDPIKLLEIRKPQPYQNNWFQR